MVIRKHKIKETIIKITLLLFITLFSTNLAGNSGATMATPIDKPAADYFMSLDSVNVINKNLLEEVQTYIHNYAPTSQLQSSELVIICRKYKFDIVLAMAQAHIESHYGTKGIASRTNSVFNVGTYDDGTIMYRYKDPNHSIEPYASLVTRNYLRDKTVAQLLKPWSFVDFKGDRYASFIYYEYRVGKVYKNILETTNIKNLYEIYSSKKYTQSKQYYIDVDAIEKYTIKLKS